jgi:hypothetical protein
MPLDAVRVGKVHRTFFSGPVAERHSKARLFIYLSDSRAKHFPRLLYQTRYEDICFVPISLRAQGWHQLANRRVRAVRATMRRFAGMNLPKHREIQETRGEKEYSVIRADLRLGFSQREGKGPLGWARFYPARAAFLPAIAAVATIATIPAAPSAVAAASSTTASPAAVITAPAAALRLRTRFVDH